MRAPHQRELTPLPAPPPEKRMDNSPRAPAHRQRRLAELGNLPPRQLRRPPLSIHLRGLHRPRQRRERLLQLGDAPEHGVRVCVTLALLPRLASPSVSSHGMCARACARDPTASALRPSRSLSLSAVLRVRVPRVKVMCKKSRSTEKHTCISFVQINHRT